MKLLTLVTFCTASLLILSGCGAKPTPKKEPTVDASLPLVSLTQSGTIIESNAIALEWGLIEDPRVKGVYIYKVPLDEKFNGKDEYYDTVNNRFSTHYLDLKIKPSSKYRYYFKTYSDNAESTPSKSTILTSLDVMDSVTWLYAGTGMPRSAKIIWRPHTNQKVKAYIIQRRTLEENVWTDIATVEGRLSAEYIDTKLKDKYTYIYRIRAFTYDGITSKPSEEVKVTTKALPQDISKISATTDLSRRVEIRWEKSEAEDFLKYNLYRASNIDGSYKLLAILVNNSYIDTIEEDGKQYFYRVSVVDKDGLESKNDKQSVMGATLVKPKTPSLVEAKLIDGKVKISWSKEDPRIKSYIVQKRYKKSLFDESIADFEGINGMEFVDSEIESDKIYYYKVFGVDINGLKSEPSIEVELKIGDILTKDAFEQSPKKLQKEQVNSKKDLITPLQDFN